MLKLYTLAASDNTRLTSCVGIITANIECNGESVGLSVDGNSGFAGVLFLHSVGIDTCRVKGQCSKGDLSICTILYRFAIAAAPLICLKNCHQLTGDLIDGSFQHLAGIFEFLADLDMLGTVLFAFAAFDAVGCCSRILA